MEKYGTHLESLGADSFGSDFVFLDGQGNIPKMPVAYRYAQPSAEALRILNDFGPERMFSICGNHTMKNDTVLQMIDEGLQKDSVLQHARGFLFFGDIFQYFLCGKACTELSMASYSKMMNQETWAWEDEIFRAFCLGDDLKMPVVRSGDRLGPVYPSICEYVGLTEAPEVVTPAIHDTADAAFAVPDPPAGNVLQQQRFLVAAGHGGGSPGAHARGLGIQQFQQQYAHRPAHVQKERRRHVGDAALPGGVETVLLWRDRRYGRRRYGQRFLLRSRRRALLQPPAACPRRSAAI